VPPRNGLRYQRLRSVSPDHASAPSDTVHSHVLAEKPAEQSGFSIWKAAGVDMTPAIADWVPVLSSVVTPVFAATVLRRYVRGRKLHVAFWGIGLTMYGIGVLFEALYVVLGWNPLLFRLWYLFGAILTAAWLGQGTVYLLAPRRVAHTLTALLVIGSIFGAIRVFSATLDPALLLGGELSGRAIVTPGVRVLTPFFNIYGLVALAGGAAYSSWVFWRRGIMPNRVIGNILIALGALAPGLGGLFSRLGLSGYLYLGELLGAVLMYVGFLRSTRDARAERGVTDPGEHTTVTGTKVGTSED
jgi:hypothetical protein